MTLTQAKEIVKWWHNFTLDYGTKYWLSTTVLGIPPMWISEINELVKIQSYIKENFPFYLRYNPNL